MDYIVLSLSSPESEVGLLKYMGSSINPPPQSELMILYFTQHSGYPCPSPSGAESVYL